MNVNQRPTARLEESPETEAAFHSTASTPTFGAQDLVRIIRRRVNWIIGTVVFCFVASVVVNWMSRPLYQATATIELNKSGGGALDLGVGEMLGSQLSGGNVLQTDLQTETSIMQSDSIALAVIEKLGLATQEPFVLRGTDTEAGLPLERSPIKRGWLLGVFRSHLAVAPVRDTRLIKVVFTSYSPQQAATVANALIESYKTQYMQSHYNATSEASNWLTQQLSDLKENVEASEKSLTDFEKESGLLSLPSLAGGSSSGGDEIHSIVIQKLDMLNTELTTAESNRITKEAIYRLVSEGSEDAILELDKDPLAIESKSVILAQGGDLANLQQLRQQRNQLKIAIADAGSTYGANNRHLKEMQTQEQAINSQIQSEIKEMIRNAQSDYLLAKKTEDVVRKRLQDQQAEASRLNEKAVQLAVLSQEASSKKKLYEDLFSKLQEANVSAGIRATNISVVDPARTQSLPVRPRRTMNYGIGLLAGVLLGFGIAFAVDSIDSTIVDPMEIEEITSSPVIGVVPIFSAGGRRSLYMYGARRAYQSISQGGESPTEEAEDESGENLWVLRSPNSAAAEAIRAVRTSIMLSGAGGGPHVLLVTSCFPSEGKSTVSANLAVSFVQHGRKVVIIEADMRRPSMKHVMNVEGAIGLSNVLSGSASVDDVKIRGVGLTGLDVIPAGPRPPLPSELLGSVGFDRLLAQLKTEYDLVIIDSPPALLLTDAVSIASKVDGMIWIVRSSQVKRQQLARAAQMIRRNAMPLIGFVVNYADSAVDGYGYGYEYRYYGHYYGKEDKSE